MKIDRETLKQNKKFLLISIIAIIVFLVVSIISNNSDTSHIYDEVDLPLSGESNINKLIINEYMTANKSVLIDQENNTYDWIELYNGTDKNINLKNYGLSDDENRLKWVFPDVVIEAKSYLVIYLCGETKDGLYAPFKLSSSGKETIVLKNANGKVLDTVTTLNLLKNQSAFRELNGEWAITVYATPNYENTKEGYDKLHSSLVEDNSKIKINEILPKNNGNFLTENKKFYGYVELINISNEDVVLDNYYLSNNELELYKYKINNITLKPNEVVVIYMGINNNKTTNLYAGFDLDNKEGSVILSNNLGKIIEKIDYNNLANGLALSLQNDNYVKTSVISPGYSNTNEGVEKFSKQYLKNNKTLLINEVMNSNNSYLAQNGYNFYDWIELYNNSNETINLKDYALTATTNNVLMYQLPDITMKPNTYYILMASGDINLSNKSYNHTNFKLSEVESLYLYKKDECIDSMMIANIPLNYSYGRGNDSGFYYLENPTPGKVNKVGVRDISSAPIFSNNAGVYNDIKNLSIEIKANGPIYYTTDGSVPTSKSKKYSGPIVLSKTTSIKAVAMENGKLKSDIITNSYIINENHTLPVVSVTINNNDLRYMNNYIYTEKEFSGYMEFYEDNGSFSIPCSISLFGGTARELDKKSFSIRFKSEYGASELVYPLFENRDTSVYESLVLRTGSTDYEVAFIRDILGTSLVDDYTDLDVQAYKSSILYINGEYYGVYNIREKVNADFIANHYNVDPDKLNLIQGNNELKNGSSDFYDDIIRYVRNNNMASSKNYEYIKTKMDIENYIDFWIAELYIDNRDIINIRFFSHPDIDDGKMKMIFFDLDWAFYFDGKRDYYSFMTNANGMTTRFKVDTTLMRSLLKNSEFKKTFLERLSYNMKNTWKKENVLKRYNEIYEKLYPEMARNQKRWGLSMKTWENEMEYVKTYLNNREKYLLKQTKSFFNLSDKEYEYYFGGDV